MGWNDRIDDDEGYADFLQSLIDDSYLEGAAEGITKQVITKGEESLSDKQKYVFDKEVLGKYVKECTRCGINIPWSEMSAALENGGFCNYCEHMMSKDD